MQTPGTFLFYRILSAVVFVTLCHGPQTLVFAQQGKRGATKKELVAKVRKLERELQIQTKIMNFNQLTTVLLYEHLFVSQQTLLKQKKTCKELELAKRRISRQFKNEKTEFKEVLKAQKKSFEKTIKVALAKEKERSKKALENLKTKLNRKIMTLEDGLGEARSQLKTRNDEYEDLKIRCGTLKKRCKKLEVTLIEKTENNKRALVALKKEHKRQLEIRDSRIKTFEDNCERALGAVKVVTLEFKKSLKRRSKTREALTAFSKKRLPKLQKELSTLQSALNQVNAIKNIPQFAANLRNQNAAACATAA
ncbi:MAG: hypothetical protein P1V97_27185, partial [Planctomycetota bacterium]|nr:hypothetical protein [Planctomycetota bacterium]